MFFFVKHKTAYDMRISDWSSDVCSSDLVETPFSVSTIFGSSDMESPRYLEGPSLPARIFPAAFLSVKEANDHFRPLHYGRAFCGKMARTCVHHRRFGTCRCLRVGQWENGAACRTRTCDPIITNDVLYHLS